MKTEVLIVGAGPTGLSLAAQFLRFGIDFVIVDKKESITPHSKAIGVQARTLEIYEQIDLAGALIEQGAHAQRARMIEGGRVRGEVDLEKIGEGMSPYPFVLLVEQGKHERILLDHIHAKGSKIRWNTELVEFSQDGSGVTATIKDIEGVEEKIEAKFLVGCDGAKSFVRNALGLKFEGGTFERFFYVADVEIDWEFSHDALNVFLSKNSVTAFFPMRGSDKNFRIVGAFPESHAQDEGEPLYEEIERQIIFDTEMELDITKVNWFSVYKVHSRAVDQFSLGKCFLAGDSAHIHTPVGAQGMNTGIQDGYNLAWKIASVLRGNADEKLLATYNEERLPNARRLLQTTDRFFHLAADEDRLLSFVRTNIFPYVAGLAFSLDIVKETLFPLVSQIGINYRGSSLSSETNDLEVKAGDRMPWLLIEGKSIYDRIREPKFHVLVFADGKDPLPNIEPSELFDIHIIPLYPHIAKKFGSSESFTVLLRPDNYIGSIIPNVSNNSIRDYFRRVHFAL